MDGWMVKQKRGSDTFRTSVDFDFLLMLFVDVVRCGCFRKKSSFL